MYRVPGLMVVGLLLLLFVAGSTPVAAPPSLRPKEPASELPHPFGKAGQTVDLIKRIQASNRARMATEIKAINSQAVIRSASLSELAELDRQIQELQAKRAALVGSVSPAPCR